MKRYFVNPKALKGKQFRLSRNGNKVEARIKGQATSWQVIN